MLPSAQPQWPLPSTCSSAVVGEFSSAPRYRLKTRSSEAERSFCGYFGVGFLEAARRAEALRRLASPLLLVNSLKIFFFLI